MTIYCNKCGYIGDAVLHKRPGTEIECGYMGRAVEQEVTKPQEPSVNKDREGAYNVIDRHLRNTLDDYEYADYSTELELIFTTPQHCPNCAEGMVSVTKEDANNYCRILTLLGMEEEGSPVEGVERLISLRDGMTCGDCNDTGWLENREEGRYPCTCMTETEPYQILQAKCAELEAALATLRGKP